MSQYQGQTSQNYRQVSDDVFYSNFRSSAWRGNINQDDRRAMLQEALRRDMVAQGAAEKDVPQISFHKDAEMEGCEGVFRTENGKKEIWINEELVNPRNFADRGEGFYVLNTTLHEGRHAYQKLALENQLTNAPDAKTMELLEANNHDVVLVKRGSTYQLGQTYLDGEGGNRSYNLYRLQYKERDADTHAMKSVGKIVDRQKEMVKQEQKRTDLAPLAQKTLENDLKDMEAYEKITEIYSVKHQIENANRLYFTTDAEKSVDNALLNLYHGYEGNSRLPAHPLVENDVKHEAINSYNHTLKQSQTIAAAPSISNHQSVSAMQNDQPVSRPVSHGRHM